MNTWKLIFATVIIFAAGALTGGLMVSYSESARARLAKKTEPSPAATSVQSTHAPRELKLPPPMMGPLRKDFVDRLQRELKMDVAQRERIEKIIRDGQEITRLIWLEVEPDIFHTMIETKEKIRAELTPEQLEKFETLIKPKPKTPASTNAPSAALTNTAPAKL